MVCHATPRGWFFRFPTAKGGSDIAQSHVQHCNAARLCIDVAPQGVQFLRHVRRQVIVRRDPQLARPAL